LEAKPIGLQSIAASLEADYHWHFHVLALRNCLNAFEANVLSLHNPVI
jgi:hypothetical protein